MTQSTYKLSEICYFQGGYSFKSSEYQSTPENAYDVFRMGNIARGGGINFNANHAYINKGKCDGLNKFVLEKNDLVMCMTDMKSSMALLGHTALIPEGGRFILNQRVGRLRVKDANVVDIRFLYFFTNLDEHIQNLRSRANSGVQVNLTTTGILDSVITLPTISEQRAIAGILGALDDKIELNRRMNRTLESMARAVFRQWLVESEEVESWEEKPLYEYAEYINGAAYRDFDFSSDNSGLPIIKIAEIKNGITSQTKFTNKHMEEKYRINNGDLLFAWSGSPDTSIDTFIWSNGEGWLNQHIFKVIPPDPSRKWFTYLLLKHFKEIFIEIARDKQTTGLGHVTVKDLKRLTFSYPPENVLAAFSKIVDPMIERLFANEKESRTLASLRDTLLPKLMRGEMRVKEGEEMQ